MVGYTSCTDDQWEMEPPRRSTDQRIRYKSKGVRRYLLLYFISCLSFTSRCLSRVGGEPCKPGHRPLPGAPLAQKKSAAASVTSTMTYLLDQCKTYQDFPAFWSASCPRYIVTVGVSGKRFSFLFNTFRIPSIDSKFPTNSLHHPAGCISGSASTSQKAWNTYKNKTP